MYQWKMIRTAIFGIAAVLLFMSNAMAQTVVNDGDQAGAFDQLSPGGQKHAQSLFDAQQAGDGGEAMSLDDIALARQETGWGNVFKQMKADGLVQEKNFGQIVSGQGKTDKLAARTSSPDTNTAPAAGAVTGGFEKYRRTKLVVTTADGNRVVVGLKRPGPKSRMPAKGSTGRESRGTGHGGGKVLKTATRPSGRTAAIGRANHGRVSTGHGTMAGMTVSRNAGIAISSGHGSRHAGNISRGSGKKAGKVK